jgi:hypothetical protein
MEKRIKCLGNAKRIRVHLPLGSSRAAWDCRPFGFGRVVAPVADGEIDIAPGVHLDLASGTLRTEVRTERRSA